MAVKAQAGKFSFQAEVVQLLDLMIHSLYGNSFDLVRRHAGRLNNLLLTLAR